MTRWRESDGHVELLASTHPVDDKRVGFKLPAALTSCGFEVVVVGVSGGGGEGRRDNTVRVAWRAGVPRLVRDAFVLARSMRTRARIVICPEIDSWAATLFGGRLRPGGWRPAVWFDSHEHYPTRAFERLRERDPLLGLVAGTLVSHIIRTLSRYGDGVLTASAGLAEALRVGGVTATPIENYFLSAGVDASTEQGSDTGRSGRGASKPRHAPGIPRIVHFGRIDYRIGGEFLREAVEDVDFPFILEEFGGGDVDSESQQGQCLWRRTQYLSRSELFERAAGAKASLLAFDSGRYNNLMGSSHKMFDSIGLRIPVIAPEAWRIRDAVTTAGGVMIGFDSRSSRSLTAAITEALLRREESGARKVATWEEEAVRLVRLCGSRAERGLPTS